MSRKCFSPLPSSFASIYLITSVFAISFISLLYLEYPQQYINHFDFKIVSLNTTTRTTITPLVVHDLVILSTNVSKTAVKPVVFPTSLPYLPQPQPPVFDIPVVNPSVDQVLAPPAVNFPAVIPSVDQQSALPAVNFHDDTVNSPMRGNNDAEGEKHSQFRPYDLQNSEEGVQFIHKVIDSRKVYEPAVAVNSPTRGNNDAEDENHSQIRPYNLQNSEEGVQHEPAVAVNSPTRGNRDSEDENHSQTRHYDLPNSEEGVHLNHKVIDSMKVTEPAVAINQADKKHNTEADDNAFEDEGEDESSVVGNDSISFTPSHFTREERMEWIKQKIPESRILESTPRTRKFEFKIQQFVHAKKCRVNIFLTWISSTKFFGKREMFSLESITKAHPNACVIIISQIMATKTGRQIIQPLLDRGHMILTVAPDFPLLFHGTPAQDWFERLKAGQVDPGIISLTQNLSNLLRLVVLYKYGGIYFDTDMIVLKDVSRLKNSIGIQVLDPEKKTWLSVNNAVLIFDKGHPLLLRFLEEYNSNFDGNKWGHNGPYMASRIIEEVLHDPKYPFNVMSPMAFYPVGWLEIQHIFRKSNDGSSLDSTMFRKISKESYAVHLWQNLSRDLRIEKGSIIGKLLSKHCILCQGIYDS